MTFATPGWFAIHALWIGALIAGIVALGLALLSDRRARLRHAVAYVGLLLMVVLPLAATLATLDLFTPTVRMGARALPRLWRGKFGRKPARRSLGRRSSSASIAMRG